MPDANAQPLDLETQITSAENEPDHGLESLVPGVTIAAHPDWQRVGDVLPMPVLAAGRDVKVSRLEPHFQTPDGHRALPLEVSHLSRQPVRLLAGEARGSVVIDARTTRTSVLANGEVVTDQTTFTAESLKQGVVLELGHRVVLVLHLMAVQPTASRSSLGLIGESQAVQRLRREITHVASLNMPVLLRGATGSGKELVARALHEAGARHGRPFVAVNLAALTPSLAAAEIFGAAKGAFTGADRHRLGFFRKAEGGTLLLDEIGEAPVEVQVMLLRALETAEIVPVGSVDPVSVDVRVIAATDADLETAIAEKRFRAPLLHRLAGYWLEVPPLKVRRDDIGRLFYHFLEIEMASIGSSVKEHSGRPWPSANLVSYLARQDWPGNVRQLRNVARWLTVQGPEAIAFGFGELDKLLGHEEIKDPANTESPGNERPKNDQPVHFETTRPAAASPPAETTLYRSPRDVTDTELLAALRDNGWRLKPAARALRVSRTSLYALIDRCPSIRRAKNLQHPELASSFERHNGNLASMAEELEVSPQGLRQRLQELGLGLRRE